MLTPIRKLLYFCLNLQFVCATKSGICCCALEHCKAAQLVLLSCQVMEIWKFYTSVLQLQRFHAMKSAKLAHQHFRLL